MKKEKRKKNKEQIRNKNEGIAFGDNFEILSAKRTPLFILYSLFFLLYYFSGGEDKAANYQRCFIAAALQGSYFCFPARASLTTS